MVWPLKYGLNPHQRDAGVSFPDGREWLRVLNGSVGYINVLDALRAWHLAGELGRAFGRPAAASVKHVHPAGAAVAARLDESFLRAQNLPDEPWSALATAYARARAGDRVASFGDFVGLSDVVDESCARLIAREVSDGVVAPAYAPEALRILAAKKNGRYVVLEADPAFVPPKLEVRSEGGVTLQQERNAAEITQALFARRVSRRAELSEAALADLLLATIVVKHTPSNAVCIAHGGQAIGIGGGQQARIYATRSACEKAELWRLELHPRAAELQTHPGTRRSAHFNVVRQWLLWDELSPRERDQLRETARVFPDPLSVDERVEWLGRFEPIVLSSDGYIPFPDNVERARRSFVGAIAQPGGSAHDPLVTRAADDAEIVMVHTGLRLFWH